MNRPVATTEIMERSQLALTYLEDGARETGLARLTDLVFDAALDRDLVVEALRERLKYFVRRVDNTVEPEARGRWASLAERLDAEIEKVKR